MTLTFNLSPQNKWFPALTLEHFYVKYGDSGCVGFYPHMPIGKVWIYRLLFVFFCFFVCAVTDFSADASGVKFCSAVHRRPRQGITFFCEFCSHKSQNRTNRRAPCGRRIGMCGCSLCQSPLTCLLDKQTNTNAAENPIPMRLSSMWVTT